MSVSSALLELIGDFFFTHLYELENGMRKKLRGRSLLAAPKNDHFCLVTVLINMLFVLRRGWKPEWF